MVGVVKGGGSAVTECWRRPCLYGVADVVYSNINECSDPSKSIFSLDTLVRKKSLYHESNT